MPLLPGPLVLGMVVFVRIASMGYIELFNNSQYLKSFDYVRTIINMKLDY